MEIYSFKNHRRNGKGLAVVKCTNQALRTIFKDTSIDFLDYSQVLKEIAFMLNSLSLELLLGVYTMDAGAQEVESNLPETWTAITANDLMIGDGRTGCQNINYSPDTVSRRLAYIQDKIDQ